MNSGTKLSRGILAVIFLTAPQPLRSDSPGAPSSAASASPAPPASQVTTASPSPASGADTAAGLQAYFEAIRDARKVGDDAKAVAMTTALIPDEARIRKALRPDVAPADLAAIVKIFAGFKAPGPGEPPPRLGEIQQTVIEVHESTTEEIIAYKPGTVAFEEFPGGSRRVGERVLRPGMKFYEVETKEPGEEYGTKLHLFFWDGSRWTMLGPVWRAIR